MIGWVLYALGVILCAVAAYVNGDNTSGLTPSLAILGIGLIVGSVIHGISKLDGF